MEEEVIVKALDMYFQAKTAGLDDLAEYLEKQAQQVNRIPDLLARIKELETWQNEHMTTYQQMYIKIYAELQARYDAAFATHNIVTIDDALNFIRLKVKDMEYMDY